MEQAPRILVVDDEEVVLLSVRKALKRDGYDIDTVEMAAEAVERLKNEPYDVMITDLMMPGMDGMQLLEHVKKNHGDIRVVMITGYATMATAMRAIRQGAFDFIAKPFTKVELGSAVSRAVRHGPMESSDNGDSPSGDEIPEGLASPGRVFTLRDITWARIEPNGKVKIGVEGNFIAAIGELITIELPETGDRLVQGNPCARLTAGDARVHSLWSPLSGRVLAINNEVVKNPLLAAEDPRGKGWLIEIDATNLEFEIENLGREGG
jgi:CheY-like chemotaxis protein